MVQAMKAVFYDGCVGHCFDDVLYRGRVAQSVNALLYHGHLIHASYPRRALLSFELWSQSFIWTSLSLRQACGSVACSRGLDYVLSMHLESVA
jgi:hypothetical protein